MSSGASGRARWGCPTCYKLSLLVEELLYSTIDNSVTLTTDKLQNAHTAIDDAFATAWFAGHGFSTAGLSRVVAMRQVVGRIRWLRQVRAAGKVVEVDVEAVAQVE
jgi:hypothetical protein